ncbi:MAG: leucine-rich repeat domain-containing protein, partial [Lentisphaeria bacterium]|nr:leucine-rich repeat domain-containing protein [Lentisphaeria bacterium]
QHLTEVTLPKSLRYIGPGAFSSTGMSKILLPENVESVSGTSFGLLEVTLSPENKFLIQHKDGTITTNGEEKTLLYVPKTLQGTYIVPDDVTTLPYAAFYYCKNLKTIKLHNGIKSISPSVFNSCASLRVMQLPTGMTSIPGSLFLYCSSLKYVTIPDTVKVIGDLAFFGCYQLDDVQLPAGLTRIGGQAFQECASMRKIKLPDSLVLIGGQAFSGCSSLKEITIPDSVESIGHGAFSGCTSLKSISFPARFSRDYIRKLGLPSDCKIKRRPK